MATPFVPNTTCDVFHGTNAPGLGPPDLAAVPCRLTPAFLLGANAQATWQFTHYIDVPLDTDIRDYYALGSAGSGNTDKLYIPDENGTGFWVMFCERHGWGTPNDFRRVYLNRLQATFPTSYL